MIETPHADDARRRVPVYSLYSETREPTAEMLAGLDVLVIDLQDIGARIYTYIYTMANCLRAAKRHGVQVIVCDRPNPIGGIEVEGPMLAAGLRVVRRPVPDPDAPRHDDWRAGAPLQRALRASARRSRSCRWRAGRAISTSTRRGLPWVMPSPNMPTLDTAIVYPGTVLFEGTLLSEGRGTTRPFELVGAPWIDAERFAAAMNGAAAAGRLLPAGRLRADVPEAREDDRAAAARFT